MDDRMSVLRKPNRIRTSPPPAAPARSKKGMSCLECTDIGFRRISPHHSRAIEVCTDLADRLLHHPHPARPVVVIKGVRCLRACDKDRRHLTEGDVQRLFHVGQQRAFSFFVRLPDRLVRYLVDIFQDFRLMRPLRDDGLKKPSHFGVGPGRRMHAIGDCPHLIAGKDLFCRLRVTLRNSVDVTAQVKRCKLLASARPMHRRALTDFPL